MRLKPGVTVPRAVATGSYLRHFIPKSAIRNPKSASPSLNPTDPCLRQYLRLIVSGVNTLAEIEAAVESLPPEKKEELLRFIAARLRDEPAAPPQPRDLSRSKRGFPISKGRAPFTSADVARIELVSNAI